MNAAVMSCLPAYLPTGRKNRADGWMAHHTACNVD